MLRKTAIFFLIYGFSALLCLQAQKIQLSGAVVDRQTLEAIAGVTIQNITANTSTLADEEGIFEIAADPGDTLRFNSMLHKPADYIVPPSLSKTRYGLVQILDRDGIVLKEVEVYGFPTQEQFEQTFFELGETELTKQSQELHTQLENITEDPTHMQAYLLQQGQRDQLYEMVDQMPPNNLLNPARWRRFIRDWREGNFSREAMNKLENFPQQPED